MKNQYIVMGWVTRMARKKGAKSVAEESLGPVASERTVEEKLGAKSICPTCGKEVLTHMCRFCGATKCINSVSGNVIWMRNGRLIQAFRDEKQAYVEMATRYGIPESEWPERFKSKKDGV